MCHEHGYNTHEHEFGRSHSGRGLCREHPDVPALLKCSLLQRCKSSQIHSDTGSQDVQDLRGGEVGGQLTLRLTLSSQGAFAPHPPNPLGCVAMSGNDLVAQPGRGVAKGM